MNREITVALQTIRMLNLDLTGLNILTECGTGHFSLMPIIAGLARANKINVYIKDSAYGSVDEIENNLLKNIDLHKIKSIKIFKNELDKSAFEDVDIITNSGMLRPLNRDKLSFCNRNVVIPLMYEKWEFRPSDIDLDYCRLNNILVGGTWENYPGLNIFDFCQHLILKIIFNAGYEIRENKAIIFSSDHFGILAKEGIEKNSGEVLYCGTDSEAIYQHIASADFIFFTDYMNTNNILTSENSLFDANLIRQINPSIGIIHLAGNIDFKYVESFGLKVFPRKNGQSIRMTESLSYLGDIPTIRLLVAGFKVGYELRKNQISSLTQLI